MEQIPVPPGLLSCLLLIPLRGQEPCQKQAGIPHRGRSATNMKTLLLLLSLSLVACAAPKEGLSARRLYDRPEIALSEFEGDAIKGDPRAIHYCFLAAYIRSNDPYMGGEDLEALYYRFESILSKMGDKDFSIALMRERPEIQSAVSSYLTNAVRGDKYPLTAQVVRSSQDIKFPVWLTYQDIKSPLLTAFIEYDEKK